MEDVVVAEIDPVCGMKVLPEKAAASVAHAGRTWYFCSHGGGAKFEANPGKYDGSAPTVTTSRSHIPTISGVPGSIHLSHAP